jgi:DNA-binding IclR family transcriptional regulator
VKENGQNAAGKEDGFAYVVPAVDRAVRILLMLSTEGQGMTLAEIVSATGWHKSSIHKILMTLARHGFLERDEATRRYVLGIQLAHCGKAVLKNLQVNHSAKLFLRELSDFSGETANLAVLRGSKMVIVDVVEPPAPLRVTPPIGTIDPATIKSYGKAALAWLPEDQIDAMIRIEGLPVTTKNSNADVTFFKDELARVRAQGYAIDVEEVQEGVCAVSAPLFNSERQVLGALSIIGPAFRMTKEKLRICGKKCAEATARLSPLIAD